MGSGTKRKPNDNVLINRPIGMGIGGANEDLNIVCPPTFRVKLATPKPLPEGTHLDLEKETIFYSGQKVGSLTSSQIATVTKCLTLGYRYSGKVVNENNKQYGVFTRT